MEALGARRADGPKRRAATYANTQLGLYALCAISNRSRSSLAVTVAALNRFDANLSLLRLEKTLDGAWIVGNATSSHYRWRLGQTFSAQSTCYLEALAPDALEGVGAAVRRVGRTVAARRCPTRTVTAIALIRMSNGDGYLGQSRPPAQWASDQAAPMSDRVEVEASLNPQPVWPAVDPTAQDRAR